MTGFASKLINSLFKKTSARPAAVRRRAALGLEPLELRAVLSTVMPTTVADDVVVDGPVITGENFESARSGGGGAGGGMGGGKVSMQDFHFNRPDHAANHHAGGVNVLLGDGSVRFVRDSVDQASAQGSGGGVGKVSMQGLGGVKTLEGVDPADILVGAGPGAPGGHVKIIDVTLGGELGSFVAFPGFNGGVSVAAGDIGDDANLDSGRGTHVAGTIGAVPPGTARLVGPTPHVKVFGPSNGTTASTKEVVGGIDSTGIDYSHPDLYRNVWINQSLEDIIDDLASDVARQG